MPVTKPHLTVFGPANDTTVNLNEPFPVNGQVTNPFVSGEPVTITSVIVRVDGGPIIEANLTAVKDRTQTKVNFAASAQVTGGEDPHTVTVTATNDQGASTTRAISVLTGPIIVPPPPANYTVQHAYIDSIENVTLREQNDTTVVTYSLSREILIRHPGQLQGFAFAEYFIHEQADGTGPPSKPKRVDLPLSIKVYSPDGLEFAARSVTLDDLNRFRDLRDVSQGSWRVDVYGDSGPIPVSHKDGLFVSAGKATVKAWLDEPVPSQSAEPLVEAAITKVGAQVFPFDLFRVGQFAANVQSRSRVTPWEGTLRLKAPDGTVVASSHNNRLDFAVTLRSINQSRDAAGRVRPWSLEVDTITPLGLHSAVRATVIAAMRIPVIIFQDRINDLIGFNGSKILVYGENQVDENKRGRVLGRFKILNEYTTETINMHHLLDSVIRKGKPQDPGVDTDNIDIEPNVAYNFVNKSASLGEALDLGVTLDVSSLKVDAIKIRIGASQHIQPQVPAVAVELDVEGELNFNLNGFNLGNASLNNHRIAVEVGAKLDASDNVATVSWVNDDPFDLNVNWEAAVLAGKLTSGLSTFGLFAFEQYVHEEVLDPAIHRFQSIISEAIFQTPFIMSQLLGDSVTLNAIRMDNDTNEIVIDYVAPVEPEPKPNPFYTGVIGRSVKTDGPGSWQISPPDLGDTWAAHNLTKRIDHIVVVMMENRSFDHVLGYRARLPNAKGENGLSEELCGFLKTKGFSVNPLSNSAIVPNRAHLKTRFPVGVGHALADVAQQLSGTLQWPSHQSINSPQGFVDNFASRIGGSGLDEDDVLGYYTDSDLAMYRFLAENYTYCQRYFSSHPGPTLPNRMYSLAGDVQYDRVGEAILDNNNADNFRLSRALSIFDLLTRKNIGWRVYESFPSITMLRFFARYAADDTNIVGIGLDELEKNIAKGDLKSVTFIDPAMHSAPQNDDHPPFADMLSGQVFIKRVYDALHSNETLWLRTLLIITYDEHGGFYDHVIPPVADALSMPGAVGAFKADMTIPYGLRVPAFAVSPWVPAGRGSNVILDHCSILKTILARFCGAEKPFLSDRVHASHTFESFLKEEKPRLDVPPPPALPSVFASERLTGEGAIATKPLSRKALAQGDVELHDLMGMLARLLGR